VTCLQIVLLHLFASPTVAPTDLAVKETTHSLNVTWESQDRRAVYFEARIAPLDSGETVEQVQVRCSLRFLSVEKMCNLLASTLATR